ncbi:MAG: class I SAM-dependent methyltransferase [Bryobacteraceae bacterium]|jgi:SAM-dependent methyltransferase
MVAPGFPRTAQELLRRGEDFRTELRAYKQRTRLPGGWYPFESLSSLAIVADLLSTSFPEILDSCAARPAADIGCGDGDFALLLANWGMAVDAIDYEPNNFNGMRGVDTARQALGLPVDVHRIDLDKLADLPRSEYGLSLFLGTLYHLKNPYGLLETLAFRTHWCVLSTRIAQVAPATGIRIEEEPLAYLADGREVGGDATNFWFFSPRGLLRLLQRTRWAIRAVRRVDCLRDSNPVDPAADERAFVLIQSRVFYPGLAARPAQGWHQPEDGGWRWTAKAFSLDVVLPLERPVVSFVLHASIPEAVIAASGAVTIGCAISGAHIGDATYSTSGPIEFRCDLPPFALHDPQLRLDFSVLSSFAAPEEDRRELGLRVPFADSPDTGHIPFSVVE